MLELIGRDLTKTLESGNLWIGTKLIDGFYALLFGVAVSGDEVALAVGIGVVFFLIPLDVAFLVTYAEEWSLKNVYMSLLDEVGEELQEEGKRTSEVD